MSELNELSKTLYVLLVGRIYALTHHPAIIADSKVLTLEPSLPAGAKRMRCGQSGYTMLTSVARSMSMDWRTRVFLADNPHGAVINVGCGLETTFWRYDNRSALWLKLDFPGIIEVRKGPLVFSQRHVDLPGGTFDYLQIDQVEEYGEWLTIIIMSGVFYYFHEDEVVDLINHLVTFHNVCVVSDSTFSIGVKMPQYYMKRMRNPFLMCSLIDDPRAFVDTFVKGVRFIGCTPYYHDIGTYGVGLGTRMSMRTSDASHIVTINIIQVRQQQCQCASGGSSARKSP